MNGDGKMDKKEFSIACHLISTKLKGLELPKALPASLKADPVPTIGSFGVGPMPSSGAIVMGTMPAISSQPLVSMGKTTVFFFWLGGRMGRELCVILSVLKLWGSSVF